MLAGRTSGMRRTLHLVCGLRDPLGPRSRQNVARAAFEIGRAKIASFYRPPMSSMPSALYNRSSGVPTFDRSSCLAAISLRPG